MRALLLVVFALFQAPASRAELPAVWADAPDGRLGAVHQSIRFDGGALAVQGGWIVPWCDAATGEGRVVVQKLDDAGDGLWGADGNGLRLGGQTGMPFQTCLVSDGEDGGFLAWQETASEAEASTLWLQRVDDGPGGHGAPRWEEPLLVAEEVWLAVDDCRGDVSTRCRSRSGDWSKSLVSDGQGGVWIVWRETNAGLRVQHVDGDGQLSPLLPAEGLSLRDRADSWSPAVDGDGRLALAVSDSGRLLLRDLGPDGELRPADGWTDAGGGEDDWILAEDLAWSAELGLCATWLAHPSGTGLYEIHAARFDSDLGLLPDSGLPLASSTNASYRFSQVLRGAERWVAWSEWEEGVWLQKADEDGAPLWEQPRPVYQDDRGAELMAMAGGAGGLHVLLALASDAENPSGLWLQRFDGAGQPLWPAEGRLVVEDAGWRWLASLDVGDDGSARLAHLELQNDGGRLAAWRLGSGGDPLWGEEGRALETDPTGGSGQFLFCESGGTVYRLHANGENGRLRRFSLESGEPLDGPEGLPLPWPLDWRASLLADGAGGLWIATPRGGPLGDWIKALHLGADGGWAEPVDLLPGIEEGDQDLEALRLAADGGLVAVVSRGWAGLHLQVLAPDGARRWGEAGRRIVGESSMPGVAGLLPLGDGGAAVVWLESVDGNYRANAWLQVYDAEGGRLDPQNEPEGVRIDGEWSLRNHASRGLARLADDRWELVARCPSDDWDYGGHLLKRAVFRTDGEGQSLETLVSDPLLALLRCDPAPDGRLLAAWTVWDGEVQRLHQRVWDGAGALERSHEFPLGADYPVTLGGGWPLSTVVLQTSESAPSFTARGFGLPDGGDEVEELWSGALSGRDEVWVRSVGPLREDGRLLVVWDDWRGDRVDYGRQLRMQLVQAVESGVGVEDPPLAERPRALLLLGAAPNPFNPSTWITFELGSPAPVTLDVFDILGRRVRAIDAGPRPAGQHRLLFDGSDSRGELASGVYVYRLRAGGESATGRLLLLR